MPLMSLVFITCSPFLLHDLLIQFAGVVSGDGAHIVHQQTLHLHTGLDQTLEVLSGDAELLQAGRDVQMLDDRFEAGQCLFQTFSLSSIAGRDFFGSSGISIVNGRFRQKTFW